MYTHNCIRLHAHLTTSVDTYMHADTLYDVYNHTHLPIHIVIYIYIYIYIYTYDLVNLCVSATEHVDMHLRTQTYRHGDAATYIPNIRE